MFTPHLVPLKRGMHATTVFEMTKDVTEADIASVYK
jgi:N-acetyl-gamma-glutamylphosphate reductase